MSEFNGTMLNNFDNKEERKVLAIHLGKCLLKLHVCTSFFYQMVFYEFDFSSFCLQFIFLGINKISGINRAMGSFQEELKVQALLPSVYFAFYFHLSYVNIEKPRRVQRALLFSNLKRTLFC